MKSKIFAILPDSAVEWERRRVEAFSRLPKADLSQADKDEITGYIDANKEFIRQYLGMMYNQRQPMQVQSGVATIHVNDYLGGNLTFIDRCMGASDYADILADVRAAKLDPKVKCALVKVDSGGGCAGGCVEIGQEVAALNDEKLTYAYTDSLCCSAAYAIACGASGIFASPSALVGSIGTILTFFDYEKMLADAGITPHIITSAGADLKASATPTRAPTEAEAVHLQGMADEYGQMFQQWVMQRRDNIASDGFRGQALSGRESRPMGYIDGTLSGEEVFSTLAGIASVS